MMSRSIPSTMIMRGITTTTRKTSQIQFSHRFLSSSITTSRRTFSSTQYQNSGNQNSTPGWEGRSRDDHVVKRQNHDVQSDSSHEAMKSKEQGKDGSSAISQKDEGNNNERAKKDNPEAPGPVIGMNDERGGKGH